MVGIGFVVELTFLNGRAQARRPRRLLAAAVRQMSCRRTRRARVRALAKINLDLRVLGKRPDGFHELRTVFQTISLADTLDIAFTPARTTEIALEDDLRDPRQPGGARGAACVMDAMRAARPGRDAADETHPDGRGTGRRVVATPRRCCWRCPCSPGARIAAASA